MFLLKTNRIEVDQTIEIYMDPYLFPIVDPDGIQRWYNKEGVIHRENGPAVIYPSGTEYWYRNGKYHREDGPAVNRNDGYMEWRINDKFHREDGPALIWPSGKTFYFLNGKALSKKEFRKKAKTINKQKAKKARNLKYKMKRNRHVHP